MGASVASERTAVRVDVLGPLRLVVDDRPIEVPGPKRRAVLALLAMAEGRTLSTERLVDELWPYGAPDAARASLQSHVSRLRGHLGGAAGSLTSHGGGYRLTLEAGALDVARARSLVAEARVVATSDPGSAVRLTDEARALWRGAVLSDLADVPSLANWAVSLRELRREVDDLYVISALDAGRIEAAVAAATTSVADEPLREGAVLLLMQALAAAGRAADALQAGREYRARIADDVGLDPTPALAELERRIAAGSPTTRTGVPKPATPLAGRASELATLHRLLADERLVTIVGPAGVGKTRTAIEAALRANDATMLWLAPVTDPSSIVHALAVALNLQGVRGDVLAACVTLIGTEKHLLVVDNCEHVVDAVREMVSTLLDGCPSLTVLATSREPLRIPSENAMRLAPLAVPQEGAIDDLERSPAVTLFCERALRVRPDFAPRRADLALVVDIVRRLDGLPLAIELAAGRLSTFGLDDLSARLDRALDLLGEQRQTGDAALRTLRSTIEWSYDLLQPAERLLFRTLCVFPDGVDLATAERVAEGVGVPGDSAAALARLVDTSMVEVDFGDPTRYRMLQTLRTFGLDRLMDAGEDARARELLIAWAVELVRWIDDTERSTREAAADATYRRELSNLRAAWRTARDLGRLDEAIAIVTGLQDLGGWRDLNEMWGWARELIDADAVDGHPRAPAVFGVASANAWSSGDPAGAADLARRGLVLATSDEDRAWCLSSLALVDLSTGDFDDAVVHGQQAFEMAEKPDQSLGVAAVAALYAGDIDRARTLNDRLLSAATSPTLMALHAYVAGEIAGEVGALADAERCYVRSIDLSRQSGASFLTGIASVGLMSTRARAGHIDEALDGYRELIEYWDRTGSWIQQWTTLRNLAGLLHQLGCHESAFFLEAAADRSPDAPAVGDPSTASNDGPLEASTIARIRREAATASRHRVLEVARAAIDDHQRGLRRR